MSMQKYYCGIVTPVDDPSWVPDHVNFYVYKTDEADAHIEALESAAVASALRVKELEKAARAVIALEPEWCQECGIGCTDEWQALKSLMGRSS
jgi:hypothetical protein